MIYVILAAGLGVANFIAYALLFRRARQLARQLSDMRAEHNSEWILHALRDVPDRPEQAARTANGGYHLLAASQQPIRRKRHLGLYLGGGVAAILAAIGQTARQTWQKNRGQVLSGAVGASIASTAALAAVVSTWPNGTGNGPPSAAPTVTATITSTPRYSPQEPPGGAPMMAPAPTSRAGRTPTPAPTASAGQGATLTPGPGQTGISIPPGLGEITPSLTPQLPVPTASPTSTAVAVNYDGCFGISLAPLLRVHLCHPEGR